MAISEQAKSGLVIPDEDLLITPFQKTLDFPVMVTEYRKAAGLSRNALAHRVGVDPSYLTRIEHGDREPPRKHIVDAIARALDLEPPHDDRLLVAAGYIPNSVARIGYWDDALAAVAEVLANRQMSPEDISAFRTTLTLIADRWMKSLPDPTKLS